MELCLLPVVRPNAVMDEMTMMIHHPDTSIAYSAMLRSDRTQKTTRVA